MSVKSLVVYYSRTGNTRFVAEMIAEKLKADIEELIDKKGRGGSIGFLIAGKDAALKKETQIGEIKHPPSGYNFIVLGVPVWAKEVPPAMRTYLNRHDLSKKRVAFFNTNSLGSDDDTFSSLRELSKNRTPAAQLVVSGVLKKKEEAETKVEDWCREVLSSTNDLRLLSSSSLRLIAINCNSTSREE